MRQHMFLQLLIDGTHVAGCLTEIGGIEFIQQVVHPQFPSPGYLERQLHVNVRAHVAAEILIPAQAGITYATVVVERFLKGVE